MNLPAQPEGKQAKAKVFSFSHFLSLSSGWKVPPTLRVGLPTTIKLIKTIPPKCGLWLDGWLIPFPIKLTAKTSWSLNRVEVA